VSRTETWQHCSISNKLRYVEKISAVIVYQALDARILEATIKFELCIK
jgi:hypothetical protein